MYWIKLAVTILFLLLFSTYSITETQKLSKAADLNAKAYEALKQGDYEKSYKISKQALAISKRENNQQELARSLSNLASNFTYLGNNEKALELYDQSLNISRVAKDLAGTSRALNNITTIYDHLKNYQEVLKFRNLQLEHSLLSGNQEEQLVAYVGLSRIYSTLKNLKLAKKYNLIARKLILKTPEPFLEIFVLFSEAHLSSINGNLSVALQKTNKAISIAKENDFEGLTISGQTDLAKYYFLNKQYDSAILLGLDNLKKATSLKSRAEVLSAHKLLSLIYQKKEDFKKALHHHKMANQLSETFNGEKVQYLAAITKIDRQVFETEEKLRRSQQQQKILALRVEKQKNTQVIWIISFAIIFMLLLFIYYRINSRKEIIRQKEANKQLLELDGIKDRILTNTSHELRTPLNGIIGLSDIVLRDKKEILDEETTELISLIKKSGERLSLVINDILEMSLLKNNKIVIKPKQFNLVELIKDVVTVCSVSANEKCIELIYQEDDKKQIISQDQQRLQQVLFNIIGNAVKFTDEGCIKVDSKIDETRMEIKIIDSGIGIPKDKIQRVFEGFEQVDNGDARDNQGSGLGLAISRELVIAMGGTLKLASELGHGTFVTISLPRKM